jgi:outer membrane lipopolysaccharide assembly protein LptE/RlpB
MRSIILTIIFFILSGCGYSSIYSNQKSQDFKIAIIDIQGDNEFNNFINNELKLFSSIDSKKKYFLEINSNYKKNIISKNSSGTATNYNLMVSVNFTVSIDGKIKSFQFEESINMKSNTNSFEQNNYEKNIKRNFASSIREKLIIKILDMNDN